MFLKVSTLFMPKSDLPPSLFTKERWWAIRSGRSWQKRDASKLLFFTSESLFRSQITSKSLGKPMSEFPTLVCGLYTVFVVLHALCIVRCYATCALCTVCCVASSVYCLLCYILCVLFVVLHPLSTVCCVKILCVLFVVLKSSVYCLLC